MHNRLHMYIGILLHYDEYGRIHYATDYDNHVHHDDMRTAIPLGCLTTPRRQVLARPASLGGVQARLVSPRLHV